MTRADAPSSGPRAWPYALGLAVLVLSIFLLVGVVGSGPTPDGGPAASRAVDASVTVQDPTHRAGRDTSARAPDTATGDTDARARRDRARARILAALARREAAATSERDGDGDGPAAAEADDPPARVGDGSGVAAPGMTDRIGGRDALVAALDEDFLPLADECIEAAQARDPSLQGMLAIELEVIADAEIGAVVEAVGFPESGEVHEALLHECIRETTLSTILPPPPEGGREALMLTLPIEPSTKAP